MTKLSIDKLPPGIELRKLKDGSSSLRIHFYYKGVRCRETLNNIAVTKANIKYAANLRGEILNAISKGTFNYTDHFPNSPQAEKLGFANNKGDKLIKTLLEEYQSRLATRTETSTRRGYNFSIKNYLMPYLGMICIGNLQPIHITKMIEKMTTKDKKTKEIRLQKAKTIRNHLIALNDIIDEALANKMIKENPMTHVILEKILPKENFKSDYVINPYKPEEIQKIITFLEDQGRISERNNVQFWFFSGLRPSELRAFGWSDIFFEKNIFKISQALVLKELKKTKTEAGNREIMMLPPVREALLSQKEYTLGNSQYVFFNPTTGRPWETDLQIWKWWNKLLKESGVEYRNPYQCRHTYASTLLSHGENPLWLATQMGHTNTELITKTYGKWIPDNTQNSGYKCKNNWSEFLQRKVDSHRTYPEHNILKESSLTLMGHIDKNIASSTCALAKKQSNNYTYKISWGHS